MNSDVQAAHPRIEPAEDLPFRGSDEIQGNVLAGFRKDHQVFLFAHFVDPAGARAWIGEMAASIATTRQVATFNAQFSRARRLRGGDDPEALKAVWTNLALTASGLIALAPGLQADIEDPVFRLSAFLTGPAGRAALLGDTAASAPEGWVFGGPRQLPVHAVVTVAADDPADLELEFARVQRLAATHAVSAVFTQRCNVLPGARQGHEHFGFKDGVSQPSVRGFAPPDPSASVGSNEQLPAGEFVVGYEGVADYMGETVRPSPPWMADGSFQVFRRLSQDVPGWWAQATGSAAAVGNASGSADALAAALIGRWRSGTPVAFDPERDFRSARDRAQDNAFDYADDPRGARTPLFAHIRKMNPRDDATGARRRRIIRRGIPFGPPFDPAAGRGHGVDTERGVMFTAFMASIEDQFETLQAQWANHPGLPYGTAAGRQPGTDPVIGDPMGPAYLERGEGGVQALEFRRFVHTTGAVYAFAPSLSTLRRLAEGRLLPADGDADVAGRRFRHAFRVDPVRSLDPAQSNDVFTNELLGNVFEGLVGFDAGNNLVPVLASRWWISADGRTYTFSLRADASFQAPVARPVRADDVKFTLERVLWPETASPVARDHLGVVVGADEVISGRSRELAGVRVLDERTLSVTIDRPRPYFLEVFSVPCCWVVCPESVAAGEAGTTTPVPVGSGPFTLSSYEPGERIVLQANPAYHGGAPALSGIDRPVIVQDPAVVREMYDRDEVDFCYITVDEYEAARRDPVLRSQAFRGSWFDLVFIVMHPVVQPLFADRRVRRAVAHALDRDRIAQEIGRGAWTRTDSCIPAGVAGHVPDAERIPYDPELARRLLTDAGYPGGSGFPPLTVVGLLDPQQRMLPPAIAAQLKSVLGLEVNVELHDARTYFEERQKERLALFVAGIILDYPDPYQALSAMLHSAAQGNRVGYRNPRFDRICDEADGEQDTERRTALYREADEVAIDDLAILPLFNGSFQWLQKPFVHGLQYNGINLLPHRRTRIERKRAGGDKPTTD